MQPLLSRLVNKSVMTTVQPDFQIVHEDIIDGCRLGNRRAQHELYKLYSKAMYNICLRMMNSREEAEDMLQDAFTSIFNNFGSYRKESTIGAWIKQIVINKCINELKRKRVQLTELNEDLAKDDGDDIEDEQVETLDFTLDIRAVKHAIKQLPDGYRSVFTLYLMEGYDHREIAEILDITESTSKSQFNRAKARLREILKSTGYERSN